MKKKILFILLSFIAFLFSKQLVSANTIGPPSQASNITFVSDKNSTTISWSAGDGSIARAIFVAAAATGSPTPVDNTVYAGNTVFGAGAQIGTSGWYCINYDTYNNYSTTNGKATVTITGLTVGVTYRVAVIECYSGGGYSTVAAPGNPANITPTELPTIPASNITFSNTSASATTIGWTNGDGTSRSVYMSTGTTTGSPAPVNGTSYTGNTTFGAGTQIGTSGWYCVSTYGNQPLTVTGLNPGTTYRVAIVEQKVYTNNPEYLTTAGTNNPANVTMAAAPTVQASNIIFSATTPTSTALGWTNGNGTARAVFVAQVSTGMPAPVNGTTYAAGSFGAAGLQIGTSGWYCVYDGTGYSTGFNGLTAGQTYRVAVVEHARSTAGEQYSTVAGASNPANIVAAYAVPSVVSVNVATINTTGYATSYTCTAGNGEYRAIFAAAASTGIPAPVNATSYTANTTFGQGTQIGTSGWYCIYNGPYTGGTYMTGLTPGTTYRIAVVDYNLSSGHELYAALPGTNNPANFTTTTISTPTIAASNVTFTNTTASSTTISWTSGNGGARVVFVVAATGGTPAPVGSTSYNGNTAFGAGSQIGTTGWYCVYNGTGATTIVTGLIAGITYQVAVVEYNNDISNYDQTYTTVAGASNPASINIPAFQSANVVFNATTGTATNVSWTNGNGTGRAVFVANSSTGSPSPANGTAYTANAAFGQGAQIGTSGWYCVYTGTGSTTPITGLTAGKTYRAAVMDYTGTTAAPVYLTATGTNNPANVTTGTTAPATQAVIGTVTTTPYMSTINFTPGNGTSQAIFVTTAGSGIPVPINNTAYTAGAYGSGSQIGTTGWYCVYNGATTNTATFSGLTPSTNYIVAVVAYNNTPGVNDQAYAAVTGGGNNPVTITTGTLNLPTVQASNVLVTNTTNVSTTINYTNGNGQAQAIFIAPATVQGFPQPAYGVLYNVYNSQGQIEIGTTPEGLYGQAYSALGNSGWYCVGHTLTAYTPFPLNVFGLSPGTAYKVAVVTYNNVFGYTTSGQETYLQTPGVNNPVTFTTATAAIVSPSIKPYNITFSNITASSTAVGWKKGNGNKRLVFISAHSNSDLALVNGTSYTANTAYGAGTATGTSNWYCVYNGADSTANVTGLTASTGYQIAVVDFNENGDARMYGTPAYATINTAAMFTLPSNNFTVATTSLTCKGSGNGIINIMAAAPLNYTATVTVNGTVQTYPFTTTANIPNLSAGTYNVCITVAGQSNYQQCFTVVVIEPKDIAMYTSVNKSANSVDVTLSGGGTYNISLNGVVTTTASSNVTLNLSPGINKLEVTTDKPCQGVIDQIINTSDKVMAYPNPFENTLYINLGDTNIGVATIKIYSVADGRLVLSQSFTNRSGVVQLDVPNLSSGIYSLNLLLDNSSSVFKVIKK